MNKNGWPERASAPPLPVDEVHVWCVGLVRPLAEIALMSALLAADEQARAGRFHFEKDRQHYIYGRAVLRTLIGQYEQIEPAAVQFTYGEQGKPALARGDLRFNLSNAGGMALIGFARGREIGVDVEPLRRLPDADAIAQRFFSEREFEVYAAVSHDQQPQAFFNCWTRKEAFIKAIGEGLSCPLGSFDVTLRPGEVAQLTHIQGSQAAASRWKLRALEPAAGYVGAVIAEVGAGHFDWHLHCWQWPGSPYARYLRHAAKAR